VDIRFLGDTYRVEFEGEEGCPATIDSPEILPEFYLTEIYINGSDTDFLYEEYLSDSLIETLTNLALKKQRSYIKEFEMDRQLDAYLDKESVEYYNANEGFYQ